MRIIKAQQKNNHFDINDSWYIHNLRQPGNVLAPTDVQVGSFYVYKEKHGMVTLVKVLDKMTENDWTGFRLLVKRVLYSPWPIQRGTIFETGYYSKGDSVPTSWCFEPGFSLVSQKA